MSPHSFIYRFFSSFLCCFFVERAVPFASFFVVSCDVRLLFDSESLRLTAGQVFFHEFLSDRGVFRSESPFFSFSVFFICYLSECGFSFAGASFILITHFLFGRFHLGVSYSPLVVRTRSSFRILCLGGFLTPQFDAFPPGCPPARYPFLVDLDLSAEFEWF